MSLPFIIFTFTVTWWISLFIVLPFGVKTPEEATPTHYKAAPIRPNLKRKLWWNTLLAAIITLGIYLFLQSGLIPVRRVFE